MRYTMKTILIIALLLTIDVCEAQTHTYKLRTLVDTLESEAYFNLSKNCPTVPCTVKIGDSQYFSFCIYDSSVQLRIQVPRDSLTGVFVNRYEKKYLYINGDTSKAILMLIKYYIDDRDELEAANNILSVLNKNGQVTNWKAFYKAVREYEKVTKR